VSTSTLPEDPQVLALDKALAKAGFMPVPFRRGSFDVLIGGVLARVELRRRRYSARRPVEVPSAVDGSPGSEASRGPAVRLNGSTQSFISSSAASTNMAVRDLPTEAA
jgi:hypothetical protein